MSSRALLNTLASGVALTAGALNLFLGLIWLTAARGHAAVAAMLSLVSATGLPVVSYAYFVVTILNAMRLDSSVAIWSTSEAYLLVASMLPLCVVILVAHIRLVLSY